MIPKSKLNSGFFGAGNDTHALPVNHCAACGHYQEYHVCDAGDVGRPCKAANVACELYTTERPSDLVDDGYGIRARGGLVYFG